MPEDAEAVRQHIDAVRTEVCEWLVGQGERFRRVSRLVTRFDGIADDWANGRLPDSRAIVEVVNELCIAKAILSTDAAENLTLHYEPRLANTGQTIDFKVEVPAAGLIYLDVKTIRPENQEGEAAWARYEHVRKYFPENAEIVLAEQFGGGELFHYAFAARTKILEHARQLEAKIATLSPEEVGSCRMVFCSDGYRWHEDALEDFADFYATGHHRPDDPFCEMEAYSIEQNQISLARTIESFCYFERSVISLVPRRFRCGVRGAELPVSGSHQAS